MKPSFLVALALLLAMPAAALALSASGVDQLQAVVQQHGLRYGDRGQQVAALQRLLADRGFDPGPIDGVFGPLTRGAVIAAQTRLGLAIDGIAGRQTFAALSAYVPGGASVSAGQAPGAEPAGDPVARSDRPTGRANDAGLVIYRAGSPVMAASSRIPSPEALPVLADSAPAGAPEPESIALTINGLPPAADLEPLLRELSQRQMTATFFVSGEEAEAQPELLARIHQEGHEIGNLGYAAIDMRRVSPVTARALIRRTQRAIAAATGTAPRFFRPPLGLFDRELEKLVEEEGLKLQMWSNVAVRPTDDADPERLATQWAEHLFPGAVLMLPAQKPVALKAALPLISRVESAGFTSRGLAGLQL